MKKFKLYIFILLPLFYNCNNTENDIEIVDSEEESEIVKEDAEDTLIDDRKSIITYFTEDDEKVWRITSAELVNTNGTFDISTNFNVKDDEFIFRSLQLVPGNNVTDFEGSLEWRKNSDIELFGKSESDALNEYYVSSELFTFDFQEGGIKLLSNDNNFEFTKSEDGNVSGILLFEGASLKLTLSEKLPSDYRTLHTQPLVFSSTFTFESNAISGSAADMVASLANNSIYLSMREDGIQDATSNLRPERVLKYDLTSNTLEEKLFFQSDFVSKQLIVNNNKLFVVGGKKINSYDLNIVDDPAQLKDYATALGVDYFAVSRQGSAVYNNAIYLVGGSLGSSGSANRIYKYDFLTEVMTEFAEMPETRFGARAEVINDKLYIFGGNIELYTPPGKNTIYIYDLNTGTHTVEYMPTPVDVTYTGRSGNFIYVAGNIIIQDDLGNLIDQEPYIGVYDTSSGTFTELETDLNSPNMESIHSLAVFETKIYVIYGEIKSGNQGQFQTWHVLSADI